MADLGAPELLIIAVVLVLLFGAKKLPELAKGAGSALRIFKEEQKASADDALRTPSTEDEERPV